MKGAAWSQGKRMAYLRKEPKGNWMFKKKSEGEGARGQGGEWN